MDGYAKLSIHLHLRGNLSLGRKRIRNGFNLRELVI